MVDSTTARNASGNDRARWRRHYMLTRLGFHFVFVAGFAMVGGALRGFNLLLVLAGVLVGTLLTQWRYARSMLSGLSVQRRLPKQAVAGVPFRIRYHVANRGRFLPAWMFWVEEQFRLAKGVEADQTGRVVGKCAIGFLSPGTSKITSLHCVVRQRGEYRLGPITIATTFPFSLMSSRKTKDDEDSIFVYPGLLDLRAGFEQYLLNRSNGMMGGSRHGGMADGDFFGLREWQSGDNPRWIHWRTTARVNDLTVRQFEQNRRFDLVLLVDGYEPEESRVEDPEEQADVETAISLAATLVSRLGGQPSNRISLAIAAKQVCVCSQDLTLDAQSVMLRCLAETEPCDSPKLTETLDDLTKSSAIAKDLVVVSARSFEDACESIETKADSVPLSQVIAPWSRRNGVIWLNVTDSSVKHWIGSARNGNAGAGKRVREVANA